jgi:hypothetical protein
LDRKQELKNKIEKCINVNLNSNEFTSFIEELISFIKDRDLVNVCEILFPNSKYKNIMLDIANENISDLSDNIFHTPKHISLVVIVSYILMTHSNKKFSQKKIDIMGIAALAHDLLHDGRNENTEPFKMESASLGKAKLILEKYNFSKKDINLFIHPLILSTESSIRFFLCQLDFQNTEYQSEIELIHFLNLTPENLEMAKIIADADMFCSMGISTETSVYFSNLVKKEIEYKDNVNRDICKVMSFYLNNIVSTGFCSEAGKQRNIHFEKIKTEIKNRNWCEEHNIL